MVVVILITKKLKTCSLSDAKNVIDVFLCLRKIIHTFAFKKKKNQLVS